MIKTNSFKMISLKYTLYFLLLISFINTHHIFAQEMNTTPIPNWVKEEAIPYKLIDSLGYLSPKRYDKTIEIYHETQINVDSKEFFVKSVSKITEKNTGNHQKINLSYSSKDTDRKIVAVSLKKGDQDKNITKNLNWTEEVSNEYVFNKLWESQKNISLSIDKITSGDIYSLSYLDKSLRVDSNFDDGIFYSCRDSIYISLRVISKKPLNYKSFNDFPKVTEVKHDSYFEYVTKGLVIAPFKEKTPYDFIDQPFICFSRFERVEEIGESFKKQFATDNNSIAILDNLYSQLTKEELNDSIKIKNIVNYVQDTMVYQDYGLIRTYQPYWCIQGNRGDCKAKSLITIELLKRAGIEAHPVLVSSPKYYAQLDSIPSFYNFNHVIVQFVFNGDTILVDPTIPKQTDKIGAYHIRNYSKGLLIHEENVQCIDIPAMHKGKLEIFDEITDTIKRKVRMNGAIAQEYNSLNRTSSAPELLFDSDYFKIGEDNYAIHQFDQFMYPTAQTTDLKRNYYDSTSQDSIVLTQEMYYPDSLKRSFIPTKQKYHSQSSFSYSSSRQRDTLYNGLWPLPYLNHSTVANYYKKEIPLATINLDTFSTNFILDPEFGYYDCIITEDDTKITVTQNIFVSGGLPLNRWEEYEKFQEEIKVHRKKVKSLIVAKKTERSDKGKAVKNKKRKKKSKRKSKSKD